MLAYSQRGQFTFLSRCAPQAPVVIGDARLQLEKLPANSYDILVVDAFSSDAIPLHLIHISNRFINLEPVLAALAREGNRSAALRTDRPDAKGLSTSNWVALSRDPRQLQTLTSGGGWRPLGKPASEVWRDDYASILPFIIWENF